MSRGLRSQGRKILSTVRADFFLVQAKHWRKSCNLSQPHRATLYLPPLHACLSANCFLGLWFAFAVRYGWLVENSNRMMRRETDWSSVIIQK
jgi:hypothetical protein